MRNLGDFTYKRVLELLCVYLFIYLFLLMLTSLYNFESSLPTLYYLWSCEEQTLQLFRKSSRSSHRFCRGISSRIRKKTKKIRLDCFILSDIFWWDHLILLVSYWLLATIPKNLYCPHLHICFLTKWMRSEWLLNGLRKLMSFTRRGLEIFTPICIILFQYDFNKVHTLK